MKSKTYLVTGANSDIGFEVCRIALKSGNRVLALYHSNRNRLDSLNDPNDALTLMQVDFTTTKSVECFIEEQGELLDDVDAFISLATIRDSVQYGEITAQDLINHFTVNVVPHVLLTQSLGPRMVARGWGRILIGGSIGVKFGGGDNSYCYSLSKMAGELIPKAAKDWSAFNVLVNVARIGVTDTEALREIGDSGLMARSKLIPMKRLAQPEEMASTIYWFASEQNTYVTGQVIAISGGE